MVKDYSKGKIYRIVSDKTDAIYIGSTILTLEKRFSRHKSKFKSGVYCASAELLKLGDARIELVRDFPCNSERELSKAEDDEMIACCKVVNCRRASRTQAEWREDNKVEIAEKAKAYREANKAEIAERMKTYREANLAEIKEKANKKYDCPCGSKYTQSNKPQHLKTVKHQAFIKSQSPAV